MSETLSYFLRSLIRPEVVFLVYIMGPICWLILNNIEKNTV